MARSLTVSHDEKPATSPLFTALLILSASWLVVSGFMLSAADSSAAPTPAPDAPLYEK